MVEGRRRPCPSPRRVLIALTLGETISANLREYPTSQTQSAAGRGRGDEGTGAEAATTCPGAAARDNYRFLRVYNYRASRKRGGWGGGGLIPCVAIRARCPFRMGEGLTAGFVSELEIV